MEDKPLAKNDNIIRLSILLAERTTEDLVAVLNEESIQLTKAERAAIRRVLRLRGEGGTK
jgi:hypothetical protein